MFLWALIDVLLVGGIAVCAVFSFTSPKKNKQPQLATEPSVANVPEQGAPNTESRGSELADAESATEDPPDDPPAEM